MARYRPVVHSRMSISFFQCWGWHGDLESSMMFNSQSRVQRQLKRR
jgi:hypothetical protein